MKPGLDCLLRYVAAALLALFLASVIAENAAAADGANAAADYTGPGRWRVETRDQTWRDGKREREVPVRLFWPGAEAGSMLPVVLFSHGLGGSRAAGQLWAEHWASHGLIVLVMQHPGSDDALWKERPLRDIESGMKSGMTASNLGLRVGDVRFVIDEIMHRAKVAEGIWGRADTSRLGMSGHSFGAQTTLSVSGQKSPNLAGQSGIDTRIVAAIAFSPNARNKSSLARQFGDIRIPFLSITGTADGSILGDGTTWQDRTLPFENMQAGGKFLIVFDRADHMVFGGQDIRRRPANAGDARVQSATKAATLAFWKSYLQGDPKAAAWLTAEGGLRVMLENQDQFKSK
ncbi:MAG TPA: hypothetical protein VFV17_04235 [Usitatibacteraceae bacterium]|nr:hypothetical protein [Usitatibacteraceae bacterium]